MHIRPFRDEDEAAVIQLWQRSELTRPWNDPRRDIQRKRQVRPDWFLVGELEGTIVATARIQISSCAVAHGNLTINIASSLDVSQPGPWSSGGQTTVTPRTSTQVTENKSALVPLPELPTIEKVASALNALGVTPRDMMAIFQAMKQAGALQAELVLR